MKKILLPICLLLVAFVQAQEEFNQVIADYLIDNAATLDLKATDVADFKVSSQTFSKSMNVTTVYILQEVNGIAVHNTASPVAIRNNQVMHAAISFIKDSYDKANTASPVISPQAAIAAVAQKYRLGAVGSIQQIATPEPHAFIFSKGAISASNIPVKLVYQLEAANNLKLAWDVSIDVVSGANYYSARVDATTGAVLNTQDWVVSCSFEANPHNHSAHEEQSVLFTGQEKTATPTTMNALGGASYFVYPFPAENPDETDAELVISPENATASPFGWHDTNGVGGAEFTITRGNNVFAAEDLDGNNNTTGDSPDGGDTLAFNFPYNIPQDPANFTDAATVNLFYWNNIVHDVLYQYEFDEASGNFQQNNYGNGGVAGDFVIAQAQDGGGINNANFSVVPDGINGRMQMFLWNAPGEILYELLTINGGPLTGGYLGFDSNFTGTSTQLPTDTPITADLVLTVDDNAGDSTDENDACDALTNTADLDGKIAVIRRGSCNFTVKIATAEAAGAVAVIIVNNVLTDPIGQQGEAPDLGIPSVMIYSQEGEAIIAALANGDIINATLFNDGSGIDNNLRDGSLDAEVIAHEYGHGLSTRLTGGPQNAGCLFSCAQQDGEGNCVQFTEQMGEGWSDWLGLIMTMVPGDNPEDPRGIATYSRGEGSGGRGLRTNPYTTDTTINDFTYATTNSTQQSAPHGVGSVWATMIWDLTWAFIDEYGFDPDTYNGTGGNNIAFQLIIDGMKLQQCNPGFVSGRDAILMADELANDGANRCLIWETFAARGLGKDADQGSRFDRFDQVENFDVPEGENCTLLSTNDFEEGLNNNFTVFPNPTNGDVNIRTRINVGDVTVALYDINGRKVFSQDITLENTTTISTNGLRSGLYVVTIEASNYTHTTKLIKE